MSAERGAQISPPAAKLLPISTPTGRNRARWIIPAIVAVILLIIGLIPVERIPSLCTMKRTFGIGCPTCGMTRALHLLLRGHLQESLRYHPLLIPFAMLGIAWWFTNERKQTQGQPGLTARASLIAFLVAVLALIGFWIYRLTQGAVP